jgi:hypothetical protein
MPPLIEFDIVLLLIVTDAKIGGRMAHKHLLLVLVLISFGTEDNLK